jgi:hypothetical protein
MVVCDGLEGGNMTAVATVTHLWLQEVRQIDLRELLQVKALGRPHFGGAPPRPLTTSGIIISLGALTMLSVEAAKQNNVLSEEFLLVNTTKLMTDIEGWWAERQLKAFAAADPRAAKIARKTGLVFRMHNRQRKHEQGAAAEEKPVGDRFSAALKVAIAKYVKGPGGRVSAGPASGAVREVVRLQGPGSATSRRNATSATAEHLATKNAARACLICKSTQHVVKNCGRLLTMSREDRSKLAELHPKVAALRIA